MDPSQGHINRVQVPIDRLRQSRTTDPVRVAKVHQRTRVRAQFLQATTEHFHLFRNGGDIVIGPLLVKEIDQRLVQDKVLPPPSAAKSQRPTACGDAHPGQEMMPVSDLVALADRCYRDVLKNILGQMVILNQGLGIGQDLDPLAQQRGNQGLFVDCCHPPSHFVCDNKARNHRNCTSSWQEFGDDHVEDGR
jgi:hypothetical protein